MSLMPQQPCTVHVILTTHWDREWVMSFEQYRFRLVNLFNKVLTILEQEPTLVFFFDGQAVVLEDYLQIRPEQEERIRALAQAGRLVFGPWYVLPEHQQESAEATIRNLHLGMSVSRRFGAPMLHGYIPDVFGVPPAMPAILNGFNIRYTNIGDRARPTLRDDSALLSRWQWLDGSEVLSLNIAYGNGLWLMYPDIWRNLDDQPLDAEMARRTLPHHIDWLRQHGHPGAVFLSVGIDHMELRPGMGPLLGQLSTECPDLRFECSTPERFMRDVDARLRADEMPLETLTGEMRGDNNHNLIVNGVLTTNHRVKRRNRQCEVLLEDLLEPLAAIYQARTGENVMYTLEYAWRQLIQNHPHDSISACSRDEVIEDLHHRFRAIEEIAAIAGERWMRSLLPHPPLSAATRPMVTLFNPSPFRALNPFHLTVRVPQRLHGDAFELRDGTGSTVGQAHTLAVKNIDLESYYHLNVELPRMLSKDSPAERDDRQCYTVLDIEGTLDFADATGFQHLTLAPVSATEEPEFVTLPDGLRNNVVAVHVGDDGAVTIRDIAQDLNYSGLCWFEDDADVGNSYLYTALDGDSPRSSLGRPVTVEVTELTRWRATLQVTSTIVIPATSDVEGRQAPEIEHTIISRFTLYPGVTRVDVVTTVENRALNHRLRLGCHLPSGARIIAGSQFAVIERAWTNESTFSHCRPLLDYLHCDLPQGQLAILTKGLYEYEPRGGADNGAVLVTLLRSVDSIGAEAGCNYPLEHSKELGIATFAYALFPSASLSDTLHQAAAFRTPLQGEAWLQADAPIEKMLPKNLLQLDNPHIILSSFKRAWDDTGYIVRCYNPGAEGEHLTIHLQLPYHHVQLVNLAEEPIGTPLHEHEVTMMVKPFAIVTLLFVDVDDLSG